MENCLTNLALVLEDAGTNKEHLLRVTIYISDIEHWPEANKVYAKFMGDHKPARSIVPCNELHYGFKAEIDAIAAIID